LSVTDLSQSLKSPGRFLGVHFFNPPTKLQLVEVIATSSLDLKTMGKIEDILERCGKSAVKVNDSPGFIVNRLLLPYINEAAKLLDEGIAKPEDIDTAMCLGTLHPAGPLQVADLIGLDICKDILEKLADSLNNPGYKPAKSIVSLVEDGKLGRKTGEGFHTY
jgi:3-hydroxybutyryl-CoA dehydrogenase